MPSRPQWFQQLPSALDALRASSALVIDRTGLQKLFRVSPRTAVRLMNQFGGYQSGRNFLISREDLIRALQAVEAGEPFGYESRRRQRLVDDLEGVRRELRARQLKLPVAPEPASGASLPSGMRIARPGVLEVDFASAEDLLGRLYELVRLAGEDLERFESLVTAPPSPLPSQLVCKPNSAGWFLIPD
jgi:hypothetical protein